jgi:signal transduction histidine kinase
MLQNRHRSVVSELLLWVAVTLLGVGVVIGILTYLVAAVPMEERLELRGQNLLTTLGLALKPCLWELDTRGLQEYVAKHPLPEDLASLTVRTQYGDPIFDMHVSDARDIMTQRRDVYHNGQCIGSIEIALARARLRLAKRAIGVSVATIVVFGISAIIFVTTVLMRGFMRRPMDLLIDEIGTLSRGNYDRRLPAMKHAEFNAIAEEINEMAAHIARRERDLESEIDERRKAQADLQDMKAHLEDMVSRRTRDLMQTNERLKGEVRERRQAQDEILGISDRERQRIGGDLHDTLGQQLAGIAFLASSLEKSLKNRQAGETDAAAQIAGLLREVMGQARGIAKGLAPVSLISEGLPVALSQLAADTTSLYGLVCDFREEGAFTASGMTFCTHLYRIAQEAVHNAIGHGKARHITITLESRNRTGALCIEDDGIGIDNHNHASRGMGLRIMRYRAEAVGGQLHVSGHEGPGTRVIATFDPGHAVSEVPSPGT